MAAAAMAVVLTVVAPARAFSQPVVYFAAYGAALREDMSEDDVLKAIGYRPAAVSLTTCGPKTPRPWQCKIYKFGDVLNGELEVSFYKTADGRWLVNNWDATPPP
jgi:hypothetical protein